MIRAGDLSLAGRLADAPGALAAHISAVYSAFDVAVQQPHGGIRVDFQTGTLNFAVQDTALAITITAISASDLFVLREAVISLIDGFDPAIVARLTWDRPLAKTLTPPNFRLGQVIAISRPGPHYLRLRIAAPELAAFAINGLHLRLLLPPEGRLPVWPGVSEAGRTIWPTGDDRLHDPVYTIRAIDPAAGWLDVDIFLHGRGRTCHWAETVQPGAEVGLIGPGGGWLPTARHLVLAGDETALPAIARILESAAPDTQGAALILTPSPAAMQPIACPPGIRLRWLYRSAGDSLEQAIAGLVLPGQDVPGGRHLWIAGEKAEAQRLRARYCAITGWAKGETTISGYWTDGDVPA